MESINTSGLFDDSHVKLKDYWFKSFKHLKQFNAIEICNIQYEKVA